MSGRAGGQDLNAAKRAKNDEFYTRLPDIEREIKHYKDHFQEKVVFCNCDDPRVSNFFTFFSDRFEALGLKRLVTTCYKNRDASIFSAHDKDSAVSLVYDGDKNGNRVPDVDEIGIRHLKGDGDFRSPECVGLLEQADIVVTNPPFSLFREYVAQLVELGKHFLIVGNVNAVVYKDIFPLIRDGKLWLGPSITSGDRAFNVPDDYPLKAAGCGIDDDGRKFIRVKGVRWFTNLEHKRRKEELRLHRSYNPADYPRYDNYDAINVDKVADIPCDYNGVMGVPITFLDKHCPEQFEILGSDRGRGQDPEGVYGRSPLINGKETFRRLFIRRRAA